MRNVSQIIRDKGLGINFMDLKRNVQYTKDPRTNAMLDRIAATLRNNVSEQIMGPFQSIKNAVSAQIKGRPIVTLRPDGDNDVYLPSTNENNE